VITALGYTWRCTRMHSGALGKARGDYTRLHLDMQLKLHLATVRKQIWSIYYVA
jgi:hypothetical protein